MITDQELEKLKKASEDALIAYAEAEKAYNDARDEAEEAYHEARNEAEKAYNDARNEAWRAYLQVKKKYEDNKKIKA